MEKNGQKMKKFKPIYHGHFWALCPVKRYKVLFWSLGNLQVLQQKGSPGVGIEPLHQGKHSDKSLTYLLYGHSAGAGAFNDRLGMLGLSCWSKVAFDSQCLADLSSISVCCSLFVILCNVNQLSISVWSVLKLTYLAELHGSHIWYKCLSHF